MNRRGIGFFLAELLIVTLGVSISLFMANYLENRKDRQTELEVLTVIEANLQRDSMMVHYQGVVLEKFINYTERLRADTLAEPLDSLNICIDAVCSYSSTILAEVGFMEMTNNQIVLSNDTLYRAVLDYYTTINDLLSEWGDIDKKYILNDVIPFVIDHFDNLTIHDTPRGSRFGFVSYPNEKQLKHPGFQNRLVTNLIYKKNILQINKAVEQKNNALLAYLQKDLRRLKE